MTPRPSGRPDGTRLEQAVSRRRALSWMALFWEQLWPALMPALCVAALFVSLALLDVPQSLPPWLHAGGLALAAVLLLLALWRGFRRWRWPAAVEARRRLEQTSELAHRPLASLDDTLTDDHDPAVRALWQAHRRRMQEQLARLRVGLPHPELSRRDPWALRAAVLLFMVIALAVAGPDAPARLALAVNPDFSTPPPPPAQYTAWLNPPSYTGLAPQQLPPTRTEPVKVPIGSTLLARVFGGGDAVPSLRLDGADTAFERVDERNYELELVLNEGAAMQIRQGPLALAGWALEIVPDEPPTIGYGEESGPTPRLSVRLDYKGGDDYGIVALRAEMMRTAAETDRVEQLDVPLPVPGAREVVETAYHDLTAHPWAGLEVEITLVAEDAIGQVAVSEPLTITLPEREFHHPVARAVIEQRRNLFVTPERQDVIARALAAIGADPESFEHDVTAYLALRIASRRLETETGETVVDEVQKLLWDTALRIEDGPLSLAERELRELQRRLMDALARNAPDEEIEQLMDQLKQALDKYLQAMAEQAMKQMQRGAELTPMDPDSRVVGSDELQKMLDRARELSRMGAKDAAREMLRQLQEMLESLKSGTMQAMPQQMQQGNQAMSKLGELMGQQQRLMDRTFRQTPRSSDDWRRGLQQGRPGQPQQGRPGGDPNNPGGIPGMAGEQEALRRQLGEIMRQMGESMGQIPGALGRAEQAMRRAQGALSRGQGEQAVEQQTEAIDQMAQGLREMAEQMAQQQGGVGEGQNQFGVRELDPMGRPMQNGGMDTSRVRIPEDWELQRAREILDELRRRAGDRTRPKDERDYLERLIEQF